MIIFKEILILYKMKKIFFLPQWYIENRENKRKKLLRIFISIAFITNILLIDLCFLELNKIKIIDREMKEKNNIEKNIYYLKNSNEGNKNKTLDCFFILTDESVFPNINFQSLHIEDNNVDINIDKKTLDYTYFVSEIEEQNKFTIKNVLSNGEAGDEEKIKMNLQLK